MSQSLGISNGQPLDQQKSQVVLRNSEFAVIYSASKELIGVRYDLTHSHEFSTHHSQ